MTHLTYASTFAGIEGFGYAFDQLGMQCTAQIEINPHRQKVLARHWSHVPRGGDIREANGRDLGRPDLLIGGFPCKGLSIGKGHREGLADPRSKLYWEFHRLVDEHLRLVDDTRPRWTVLENVPGLLSANDGRDMAAVLMGLVQLGYGVSYRVVDSRAVGSAQRRPRVVIVGHRGGDARPAWLVLADRAGRGESSPVRGEPAGSERTVGGRGVAPDGVQFVRKSSRPRASADKGGYATWVEADFFNVLTPNDGLNVSERTSTVTLAPVKQTHLVLQHGRVRTLTPVEWERLQGFPDNWTAGIPDEERYYALGDAMNVPLALWLGKRIIEVDAALPMLPEHTEVAA